MKKARNLIDERKMEASRRWMMEGRERWMTTMQDGCKAEGEARSKYFIQAWPAKSVIQVNAIAARQESAVVAPE